MTPWLQDADVTLYHGDVLQVLRELPAESVDCCVTSPPYWGLRDYGTAKWEGGNESCDHTIQGEARKFTNGRGEGIDDEYAGSNLTSWTYRDATPKATCPKCGAHRVDGQLGLEPTPEEYVARMVEVFREVRRVLAAHGSVWLNLGDSFNEKQLVGVPWRVAFALQADGWYLRSDIIWAKPNPMPESVTDRPTKAHEYVFLLSKQPRYFFDQEAVREPLLASTLERGYTAASVANGPGPKAQANPDVNWNGGSWTPPAGRNIRSVWEIATQPYPEAHFATFPEELARRCIAAGCPEQVCRVCGVPRTRIVEREGGTWEKPKDAGHPIRYGIEQPPKGLPSWTEGTFGEVTTTTVGFTDCGCVDERVDDAWRVGVVLDPFIGSGTVAHVARKLGRHAVGIDLNESYLELAARRLQQQSLFAEPAA